MNVSPLQCIFLNLVVNDDAWVVTILFDLVNVYAYLSVNTQIWEVLCHIPNKATSVH
jgi:hypothetical protein